MWDLMKTSALKRRPSTTFFTDVFITPVMWGSELFKSFSLRSWIHISNVDRVPYFKMFGETKSLQLNFYKCVNTILSIWVQSGSIHLLFPHLKSLLFSSLCYYQKFAFDVIYTGNWKTSNKNNISMMFK